MIFSKRTMAVAMMGALVFSTAFGAGLSEFTAVTPVVQGIAFSTGEANPKGGFDQLFLIRKTDTTNSVPVELAAADANRPAVNLTVFHFNDLHGHITDQHKTKGDTHRISQMVRIVNEARSNAGARDAVLFLSAGDEHTGTPFDELSGWKEQDFVMDPAYRILSEAGLDASVIGNHEVDRGYNMAAYAIEQDAAFPVLSANILDSEYLNEDVVAPAIVGIIKGVRVGLIGLTTPDETKEHTTEDPRAHVGNPLEALAYYMERMDPYVDMFILLNHLGNESDSRHHVTIGDQAVAKKAASLSDRPIIVIGGHTHTVLNQHDLDKANIVEGIPLFQAGAYGSWLGKIAMDLVPSANGYVEEDTQARLIPIKSRDNRVAANQGGYEDFEHDGDYDQTFEQMHITPILDRLSEKMEEPLGLVFPDPEFSTDRVVAERYVGECGMGNYMNDLVVERSATFPGGKVDLAVFNASGLAGGVDPNTTVSYGDWFTVMPYADNIVIYNLTGAEILALLQSNARRLVRPKELTGADKVNPEGFISRGFLHFSQGLRYTIRLGHDVSSAKAENITINGKDINQVLEKTFRVAFSSYIANGFEGWKDGPIGAGLPEMVTGWNLADLDKQDTGLVYRNEIIAAIQEQKAIRPPNGRTSLLDGRLTIIP